MSVLQEWLPSANVRCVYCKSRPALFIGPLSFREDQNQGHWYSSVLDNAQVQDFLDNYTNLSKGDSPSVKEFTLTVYAPGDCGSLYGWKIERVLLPGRHAKFHSTSHFQRNNKYEGWQGFTSTFANLIFLGSLQQIYMASPLPRKVPVVDHTSSMSTALPLMRLQISMALSISNVPHMDIGR